jgi:hypothetical protein
MTEADVAASTPPITPFPSATVDHDDRRETAPPPPAPTSAPAARFYMTSDLRAATGLPRTHLDFYLREELIVPTARTESGYLLFNDAELATLRDIIRWRQEGVAIRDIRQRLGR